MTLRQSAAASLTAAAGEGEASEHLWQLALRETRLALGDLDAAPDRTDERGRREVCDDLALVCGPGPGG